MMLSVQASSSSVPAQTTSPRFGARAHVDDMVGVADRVLVMLDDEHGVAEAARRFSVSRRRSLSFWWRPIDGSSRT